MKEHYARMKRLRRNVQNRFLALITVGVLALVMPAYVLKDKVEKAEQKRQEQMMSLQKKIVYIDNFMEETGQNVVCSALDGLDDRMYCISKEYIDDDSVPDHVIMVGYPNDGRLPHTPPQFLVEDRSKETGQGTVDKICVYAEQDGIKRAVSIDKKDLDAHIAAHAALARSGKEDNGLLEMSGKNIKAKQFIMKKAKAMYSTGLSRIEEYIYRRQE